MKRNHPIPSPHLAGNSNSKSKSTWEEQQHDQQDVDELLAVLGYKVISSDMVDVAQKIEYLEGVFNNDDALSQLASDSGERDLSAGEASSCSKRE